MYTVECDGLVIFDDTSLLQNVILTQPKLDMSDNAAGTFSAVVPVNNIGYSKIDRVTSAIVVKKDGKWIWEGRVLQEQKDFYGQRKITCEGCLSYLNDVDLEPETIKANTMSSLFSQLFSRYNSKVSKYAPKRQISVGAITVELNDNDNTFETNYENLYEWIQRNITDNYGGHLFMSKDSSGLKINYYADYPDTSGQTIDFGENLIDFTGDYDLTKICTVCIPRGKTLETDTESGESTKTKYLTVAEFNGGSIYVENADTVKKYGRIERVVDFSDVEDGALLLKLATNYMRALQFDDMVLNVKAVDLHMLNSSIDSFDLLDQVRCVSLPHGLDKFFPLTSVSIPLDNPENVAYTFGVTQSSGMTASNAITQSMSKFEQQSTRESVLVEAKRNASEILARKTTGYVNIVSQDEFSQALIISNTPDWRNSSQYWKFDMNGLGFWKNGELGGIAITMKGEIVADMITTGTMSADRVRTGIIKDVYNNNLIDLWNGKIYLSASKTVVTMANGTETTIATAQDVSTINGNISTITTKQASFQTSIDGVLSDVSSLKASYGTSSTAASTAIKVVSCSGFKLSASAVIVIRFTYANTASYPRLDVNGTGAHYIYVNGTYMSSDYYWKAGQTVTFVYDGSNWQVSDGATKSRIEQLADSISLSVTGALGGTASIVLKADGSTTTQSINLSKVRESFQNDTSSINLRAGNISFYSGTFSLYSDNTTISADGTITVGYYKGQRLVLTDYSLYAYNDSNKKCGTITPSTDIYRTDLKKTFPAMSIETNGYLDIATPYLSILAGTSGTGTVPAKSKSITFVTRSNGSDYYTTLEFINGFMVSS